MLANNHKFCFMIIFYILLLVIGTVKSQPNSNIIQPFTQSESQILLKFKQSLNNTHALNNWVPTIPHCMGYNRIWAGLLCNNGTVWGLQLENMSLSGVIDINTLTQLTNLRTISFKNNSFNGNLPQINKLNKLRSVFFSYNNFSGDIDEFAFDGMSSLMKVYLDHNGLSGKLPKSLVELPKLIELSIQDNHFDGNVLDFDSNEFRVFNLSYNDFDGQIPPSLSHLNSSSFLGNQGLCGEPLPPCPSPTPTPTSSKNNLPNNHHSSSSDDKSLHLKLIIVITIGVLSIMTGFFLLLVRHQNKKLIYQQPLPPTDLEDLSNEKARKVQSNDSDLYPNQQPRVALERPTSYKKSDNGKLCFLRNDRQKFEMQDLLKASAEVLGSGSFGSSYKASIANGPTFVVKRFRQMNNVGKEDFQGHMKLLGRLRHPNILPLVAFFHKREEKLIISDFVENGSLASHLHGRRSPEQAGLEWSMRLKIIKGVARGLAYLYRELPQLSLPHGNLKSSNVLLDDNFEPLLSDYALSPLVNRDHAEQVMVAYKSPEFIQDNMTTKKTDVWCLGILILEIMTGQFPANYLKHGKGGNEELATWVNSVVKEEWSPDIFDLEMRASRKCKGEMLKLLKIGIMCCEWNVEKRWNLREVVEKIEELKDQDRDHQQIGLHHGNHHTELHTTISSISQSNLTFRE